MRVAEVLEQVLPRLRATKEGCFGALQPGLRSIRPVGGEAVWLFSEELFSLVILCFASAYRTDPKYRKEANDYVAEYNPLASC